MHDQTPFRDLRLYLLFPFLFLESLVDLLLNHVQVAELKHAMAGLLVVGVILDNVLSALQHTIESLRHPSESLGVNLGHRVHHNKEGQEQCNEVGIREQPSF